MAARARSLGRSLQGIRGSFEGFSRDADGTALIEYSLKGSEAPNRIVRARMVVGPMAPIRVWRQRLCRM